MNALPARRPGLEMLAEPELRTALAAHDFGALVSLLRTRGWSQRGLGVLVGMSQPEVSMIERGRQVQAYDVIDRIVRGLGVPAGWAGLSWCPDHDLQDWPVRSS